jgi:hypothetical protein
MSFYTVNSKLKAILDGITGDDKLISASYDYPNPAPDTYPAAYLILNDVSDEQSEDNRNNITNMGFMVRVVIKAVWTSAGYNKMLRLLDAVLAEYRKNANRTLSGSAVDLLVSPNIVIDYVEAERSAIIIGDVSLTVRAFNSIS